MVIKGRSRGGGRALASYLLAQGQNEHVRILDVNGMPDFDDRDLRDLLGDMSLNEQLTKSKKGLYHAILNPEENDARAMTDADWLMAADVLTDSLGFEGQRRAIVLHCKNQRWHAHVAFERYSYETGTMLELSHNYRKHDKARAMIEQALQHKPTPRHNPNREEVKAALTKLWKETSTGKEFASAARKQGYVVSQGYDRIPYAVVDGSGRSFNLVRHLDGIKTKEVWGRLNDVILMKEKEAIAFARTQEAVTGQRSRQQSDMDQMKPEGPGKEKRSLSSEFASTKTAVIDKTAQPEQPSSERGEFLRQLAEFRNKQQSIKPKMR